MPVGARLEIETLGPGLADQLDEILISGIVFCQDNEMEAIVRLRLSVVEVILGDIHLAADDRLEAVIGLSAGVLLIYIVEEFLDAVHVAMIGEGDAGHTHFHGCVYEIRDGRLAVEKTILGVHMKVRKRRFRHTYKVSEKIFSKKIAEKFGRPKKKSYLCSVLLN